MIVSALVRRGDSILLVEQQGPRDPASSWMLPGGRVEADETLLAALSRELMGETGLALDGLPQVASVVELGTADGPYSAITFDSPAVGSVEPHDPDGLLLSAAWVPHREAIERLRLVEWFDCVPLERFLSGEAPTGTIYSFDRP